LLGKEDFSLPAHSLCSWTCCERRFVRFSSIHFVHGLVVNDGSFASRPFTLFMDSEGLAVPFK
jgi:hypothetical protein